MKKNDKVTTDATTTLDDEKLKKREAKKAARLAKREAKKQKDAEKKAKKAAKLQKEKERKAAAKQKAKEKREAKKAKKLMKLQKQKEKKAAQRAKKQAIRQKKLERLAKQKAKEKALKQKAKEKIKKQKLEAKSKNEATKKPESKQDTIDITVKLLKAYVKQAAKDDSIDDKKIKKLEKLGFKFNEETVSFTFEAKRKVKKQIQPQAPEPEVTEPEVVEPETEIDNAINEVIGDKGHAIEALAQELESNDNEDAGTETPVGDTYTDNTTYDGACDADIEDNDEDDDTIDDFRDESDSDKVEFRRDWNNEFDDDGERNEDW